MAPENKNQNKNTFLSFALGAACSTVIALLHNSRRKKRLPQSANQSELKYVHPPHSSWVPGQKQPHPFTKEGEEEEMIHLEPNAMEKASLYSLMISAVIPRPVAFISSQGLDGSQNLAPYSYFNLMGHYPPIVAFAACRHVGRAPVNGEPAKKDTLCNVEETGEFVVNIISEWMVEAANYTCGDFDRGVDEMELTGLTPVPSTKVRPPRVGESCVQFECKVKQIVNFTTKDGEPSQSVVLGEVVMVHIHKDCTEPSPTGKVVVDPIKLRPISRLGGVTYANLGNLFELPRPNKDGSLPSHTTKAQLQDQKSKPVQISQQR